MGVTYVKVYTLDLMVCVHVYGLQFDLIEPPLVGLDTSAHHHLPEVVMVAVYLKALDVG